MMTRGAVLFVGACVLTGAGAALSAQGRSAAGSVQGSDPLAGPVVRNAPYSADAVTTVTQVLGDGTRIEQMARARFYRDSAGRTRREQTIIGLGDAPQTSVTIDPDPGNFFAFMLDADTRTARRVALSSGLRFRMVSPDGRDVVYGGDPTWVAAPDWTGGDIRFSARPLPRTAGGARAGEESLGTRQIEGLTVVGRRTTTTIPAGRIGNDRPIEITDERWESSELGLLVVSRYHDPRTGDVEYRLTSISRAEPPPDLFQVPPDYTVVGPVEGVWTRGRGERPGAAGAGR